MLSEFNNFFSTIGKKLTDKFSDSETYKRFLRNIISSTIYMEPPKVNEVLNVINPLNLHKSVSHDKISSYFLRVASSNLAPVISFFIDIAFRIGIFPRSCKIARVIPLFKSGKTDNLTNYRPISILTGFSKIFEKLIHKRLTNFFQKHSVLVESQYGFQNNISTTHAILDVLTTSYDQINANNFTDVILLDFQKAVDTVCHTSLLSKLEHYGIRGVAHKLRSSFLYGRQQYLFHQNMQSEIVTNRFGVPQGSNLGPLLL